MTNILKNYQVKELKTQINKYGFSYSTKNFVLQSLAIIAFVLVIAFLSKLEFKYMLILILLAILLTPFLIKAWFLQNYNIKKFTMLTDYLGNIIPIFTQKTKIRYSLGELFEITSGSMKESIGKAIKYIDTTVNDPDINSNALKIIEKDFPNSRVKSVHKLLLSIESANSIAYKDVCQNMYEDIEAWIKRVYAFEKDLKNRRNKLLILCLMALLMNSVFVYLYVANDYFVGFTSAKIYQISTLIFVSSILVVITLILTKLHGEWLINDLNFQNDDYIKQQYITYKKGVPKIETLNIVLFILCLAIAVYMIVIKEIIYAIVIICLGVLLLLNPKQKYKRTYKRLNKALTIEFPVWLREISLNLNNLTVLNAIDISINNASYPLRKEIRKFLDEARNDPTSIKPYNSFLIDYDLEDARSSMKVLYAIQNIGKEDVKERVSNLIVRNQEMLDRSESIRNNDSISGIEALGYLPTFIFTIQMMISMFSMFSYMMSSIAGAITL